ncbi:hypothetical protein L2E82_35382 [Cichorium intybus]|uniref:Uncharacterized protein n=1 Tax=Cichorium intybus TaxID=13427 RepID=A0ACB9BNS1_CICIN|nr:hypothetical protein L2E82_35382 [Cichorium intybus]
MKLFRQIIFIHHLFGFISCLKGNDCCIIDLFNKLHSAYIKLPAYHNEIYCVLFQAKKELAKYRVEVAHEIRLAKEAEASMEAHVNKAVEKAAQHDAKQQTQQDHGREVAQNSQQGAADSVTINSSGGMKQSNIPGHL